MGSQTAVLISPRVPHGRAGQAAEGYYVEAGDWDSAVNMYRGSNNWEEAYNCARDNGGLPAGNKVAYAWALTLGGEAGSKLLTRLVRMASANTRLLSPLR